MVATDENPNVDCKGQIHQCAPEKETQVEDQWGGDVLQAEEKIAKPTANQGFIPYPVAELFSNFSAM